MRFFLVTIIAFGMISFFLLLDVEYGKNSPIGIVVQEHIQDSTDNKFNTDEFGIDKVLKLNWIMHIGGHSNDNYSTGLQIPIYILIGGVFGGYLRFFYYTSNPWMKKEVFLQLTPLVKTYDKVEIEGREIIPERIIPTKKTDDEKIVPYTDSEIEEMEDKQKENIKEQKYDELTKRANQGIFEPILVRTAINRIMSDLALLFIAPVLAIMVYFLLLQGGLDVIDDMWTFVLASFTAGIFTENVIKKISENSLITKKSNDSKN
jgi:hypothetical protein